MERKNHNRVVQSFARKVGHLKMATCLSVLMTNIGTAQDAEQADDTIVLDTIIVTAQKRAQNAQEVPVSVSPITAENVRVITSGGASVRALAARVPSLNIENSTFGRIFPRAYIRGLGNTDFDLNASQPVSYIFDNVVFENTMLKGFPIFDVAQVEVLKGPQGTLFGRNTPAGVIKIDSAKPSHETSGYARLSYGRFNQTNVEAAIGGSLSEDVLSARVSLLYNFQDDFVDNLFTGDNNFQGGYDDFAARVQFNLTPNEAFSALLNVHTHVLESREGGFYANAFQVGQRGLAPNIRRNEVFLDGINNQDLEQYGVSLTMQYEFGELNLVSVTGFENLSVESRGDVDGGAGAVFLPTGSTPGVIPFPAETQDRIPNLDQFTQELRMESDFDGRLNFQVGAFIFREDYTIESLSFNVLASQDLVDGFARQTVSTRAWALFGNIEYDAIEDLTLTAGVRYSEDDKKFTAERTLSSIGLGPSNVIPANVGAGVVTWDLSALYRASEDVNLYGRIARGFRAPSIQGRILFGFGDFGVSIAEEEQITSYEIGFKSELLDRSLRWNTTIYYFDMDNQQLTATGGAINLNQLVNAADTEGYGLETDVTYAPSNNLLLTLGASYNFTKINDPNLTITACGAPCTILDPFVQIPNPFAADGDGFDEVANLDGNPLPYAPRWILNFTARYSVPIGSNELYFMTDWAFASRNNMFLYEAVEFTVPDRLEGGIRVGYIFEGGNWELAGFARNITGQDLPIAGVDFNNLTAALNQPSIWGIEARYSF